MEVDIVSKSLRINDQIDVPKVRLIDDAGKQHGVLNLGEALAMAEEKELDLVEVAPQASPVVCKLMDYGRQCYQEKKKHSESRAKQRHTMTKMVKFRPNTFKGDFSVKLSNIRRFLDQGDKVKVVLQFRGREIVHAQNGLDMFNRIIKELEDCCVVDSHPTTEGRFINMTLSPLPARVRAAKNNGPAANGNGNPSNGEAS